MLGTRIKRTRVNYFHIRHFGGFIDGDIGCIVIVHTKKPNGTLVVAQFEMLSEVAVYLRNQLYSQRSSIDGVEDCHVFSLMTLPALISRQTPGAYACFEQAGRQMHQPPM